MAAPKKGRGPSPIATARKNRRRQARKRDRAQGVQLNDPAAFTAPQSYAQVNRAADTAANLRYGPQQAQIALQQQQVPAWFDQYRASLQTPAQVQQTYQPVLAQQQAAAQQAGATTPGVDPGSQAGVQDQQAAKAREALANLGTATLLAQQSADTTYFQGRKPVADAAQIGLQAQLGKQAQTVAGEKGAYRDQYVTDARAAERTYGLGVQHQQAENAAFGVKAATAEQSIIDKRVRRRQANRNKRRDQSLASKKFGSAQEKDAYQREHGLGPYKPSSSGSGAGAKSFTPAQHHEAKTSLRKAVALVQGKLSGRTDAPDTFWEQAYHALVGEKDMDPALARAAVQLVRHGRVGRKTRDTLQEDYGITKFPHGSKRKKPPAYKPPKRPPSTAYGNGEKRPT